MEFGCSETATSCRTNGPRAGDRASDRAICLLILGPQGQGLDVRIENRGQLVRKFLPHCLLNVPTYPPAKTTEYKGRDQGPKP